MGGSAFAAIRRCDGAVGVVERQEDLGLFGGMDELDDVALVGAHVLTGGLVKRHETFNLVV